MDPNQRIAYLATLEAIEVDPGDAPARVIINSRTGTVVISSHVQVMAAAVAHGSLSVTITERDQVSQPNPFTKVQSATVTPQEHDQRETGRRAHVRVPGRREPG